MAFLLKNPSIIVRTKITIFCQKHYSCSLDPLEFLAQIVADVEMRRSRSFLGLDLPGLQIQLQPDLLGFSKTAFFGMGCVYIDTCLKILLGKLNTYNFKNLPVPL